MNVKSAAKQELKKLFQSISDLPDSEWEAFEDQCTVIQYKKGELILRAGDFESRLGLVTKGLVKRSFINENGKEYIHYFGRVGRFTGSYSAILLKKPSIVNITAIEDTEMILFNMYEYEKFYKRHRAFETITRISLEQHFIDREKREYQLLMLNAKERYDEFLIDFPDCHNQLTNKDIASYLRITPEAFSRLINNKTKT